MARNDQVTRQWFLLQALEKPGGATIEELTRSLPADYACHARTVRRDIQALEARFPIYTDRVDGQVRWKLVAGFNRVPAIQFSATELMALIFTRDLARPLEGTPIDDSTIVDHGVETMKDATIKTYAQPRAQMRGELHAPACSSCLEQTNERF